VTERKTHKGSGDAGDRVDDGRPSLARSVSAALVVFALAAFASRTEALRSFERGALDLMFRYGGPPQELSRAPVADDEASRRGIALVVVDSGSLLAMRGFARDESGGFLEEPWPWQRVYYAVLLEFLAKAGARAVLFDFDFSGPGPYDEDRDDTAGAAEFFVRSPISFLGLNLKTHPPLDPILEPFLDDIDRKARDLAQRAAIPVDPDGGLSFERGKFNTVQVPYGALGESAASRGLGFVNGVRDDDDSIRRVPLLARLDGSILPSLHLAAAIAELGVERLRVAKGGDFLELLGADGSVVRSAPLDADGRLLLHWYGPLEVFENQPFHRVLKIAFADLERRAIEAGHEDAGFARVRGWSDVFSAEEIEAERARFEGRVVLVGVNAPELGDVYTNPFAETYPGVAIHATALLNLLRGEFLREAPTLWRDAMLLVLVLGVVIGTTLAGGERRGLAVFAAIVVAYLAFVAVSFGQGLIWWDTVVPLAAISTSYGSSAFIHYLTTGRLKRRLRATFEHVLQPELVEHLLADPRRLELGGEIRSATMLFTDLQNSTALSEALAPREWVERLNRYFARGAGLVIRQHAYLDKFIGDGFMAVWGAPVALAKHQEVACRALVELRRELVLVEDEIWSAHGVRLFTRIGVNSGDVLAGMVGSEGLAHYTVLGDPVVIASRLEGANKFYGTRILIGENTWQGARDAIEAREIDLVVLKGKARPIKIYEPLALRGELDADAAGLVEEYARALELVRGRDWDGARRRLDAILMRWPSDGPARVLRERVAVFAVTAPGDDWRGEWQLTAK
jgi:adenylate cyclase